jgi:hypothetical protein
MEMRPYAGAALASAEDRAVLWLRSHRMDEIIRLIYRLRSSGFRSSSDVVAPILLLHHLLQMDVDRMTSIIKRL